MGWTERVLLAEALAQRAHWRGAEVQLLAAERAAPPAERARFAEARGRLRSRAAQDSLDRVGARALRAGDLVVARRMFAQALRLDTASVTHRYLVALVDLRTGETKAGVDGLLRVRRGGDGRAANRAASLLDTLAAAGVAVPETDADRRYRDGGGLAAAGNWEGASAEYRRAAAVEPRNARWRRAWGYALARQGRWAEAADQYDTVAVLAPSDARSLANLAVCLVEMTAFHRALVVYARGERAFPRDPTFAAGTASMLDRLGYAEAAQAARRRAESLDGGGVR
jgi:Tfp pilus assembly protein PilF